jgi:hypothetical protein
MISTESIVVASKNQVSSDLAEEAVILDLESGTYYGLDAVGFRIWDLVQEPRTVATIVNAIVAEYDVDRERCERDVLALLDRLAATGLIEVKGGEAP